MGREDLYGRAVAYMSKQRIREALTDEEEAGYISRAHLAAREKDRTRYRRAIREWVAASVAGRESSSNEDTNGGRGEHD